jgi:hypothetical protein
MKVGELVEMAVATATTAVEVALSLPRIAVALERLATTAEDLQRLADVSPAIEAIGAVAEDARRLLTDPARTEEIFEAVAAIVRIGDMSQMLGPLGDAVRQLNTAASALTTTVSPLQGASERLGRLVDRLPTKPRPAFDVDAGPA